MNFRYLNRGSHKVMQRKVGDVWMDIPTVDHEQDIAAHEEFHKQYRRAMIREFIAIVFATISIGLSITAVLFYYFI